MIYKMFQKSNFKTNNPMVLKDCTLFFRLKHFDIDDVFVFHKQDNYPFSTVGDLWLTGTIATEYNSKGYFSTKFYSEEHMYIFNYFEKYSAEEVSIIGYYKNRKCLIYGISVSTKKLEFNEGLTFKFSFMELNYFIPNTNKLKG